MTFKTGWTVRAIALCAVGFGMTAAARADEAVNYQKVLDAAAPALVNVKYVFKRGDMEREVEIGGVMIEPTGLVLCPGRGVASRGATATNIKVLVGDDEEGVEAKVLARDSELDLVWVQTKAPPKSPYVCLDVKKAEAPKLGQELLAPRRMVKYFDRAPVLVTGRLLGITHKPRDLYVAGGGLDADPGTPVLSSTGGLIGFMVTQSPDREDMEAGPITPIGGMRDYGNMILPTAEVAKATDRAKKSKGEGEEMSAKAIEQAKKEAEAEKGHGDGPAVKKDGDKAAQATKPATTQPAKHGEDEEDEE